MPSRTRIGLILAGIKVFFQIFASLFFLYILFATTYRHNLAVFLAIGGSCLVFSLFLVWYASRRSMDVYERSLASIYAGVFFWIFAGEFLGRLRYHCPFADIDITRGVFMAVLPVCFAVCCLFVRTKSIPEHFLFALGAFFILWASYSVMNFEFEMFSKHSLVAVITCAVFLAIAFFCLCAVLSSSDIQRAVICAAAASFMAWVVAEFFWAWGVIPNKSVIVGILQDILRLPGH
jgi:hypothetical protein